MSPPAPQTAHSHGNSTPSQCLSPGYTSELWQLGQTPSSGSPSQPRSSTGVWMARTMFSPILRARPSWSPHSTSAPHTSALPGRPSRWAM